MCVLLLFKYINIKERRIYIYVSDKCIKRDNVQLTAFLKNKDLNIELIATLYFQARNRKTVFIQLAGGRAPLFVDYCTTTSELWPASPAKCCGYLQGDSGSSDVAKYSRLQDPCGTTPLLSPENYPILLQMQTTSTALLLNRHILNDAESIDQCNRARFSRSAGVVHFAACFQLQL